MENGFEKRKYPRVNFEMSMQLHANRNVLKAKTVQIGAGGIGIILSEGKLSHDTKVFLHLQKSEEDSLIPPFNAIGKVCNSEQLSDGSWRYGIKFLNISDKIQGQINQRAHESIQRASEVQRRAA